MDDINSNRNFKCAERQNDNNSTDSSEMHEQTSKKVSRRGRNKKFTPSEWEVTQAKLKRNSGLSYISPKSRKPIKARALRPPCDEKCKFQCALKITPAQREEIFKNYWALADLSRQREFIATSTEAIQPKYRYTRHESYRNLNNAFYFEIGSKRLRVCKTFFKATLDINDRPIRTVIEKKDLGAAVSVDLRGKKRPKRKTKVKDSDGSDYISKHDPTSRECIEIEKPLGNLHEEQKENRRFQNINEKYNVSFLTPKREQCGISEPSIDLEGEYNDEIRDSDERELEENYISGQEEVNDKEEIIEWTKEAVLALAEIWSSFPCLYDTSNRLYCNKHARCDAIHKIKEYLEGLLPGLEDEDVKTKITHLRSQFTTEVNKQKFRHSRQLSYDPAVYWFPHLEFLREHIKERKPKRTSRVNSDTGVGYFPSSSENSTINNFGKFQEYPYHEIPVPQPLIKSEFEEQETAEPKPVEKKRKRKRNYLENESLLVLEATNVIKSLSSTIADIEQRTSFSRDIEYFGKFVMAELETLNVEQQIDVKQKISSILFEARKSNFKRNNF